MATGTVDVDQLADVYPGDASTGQRIAQGACGGKANPELNRQISSYEYRIGVGDILNVTVWDPGVDHSCRLLPQRERGG